MTDFVFHVAVMLSGVFLASFSQVLLKKSANRAHSSIIHEYVNPMVIGAYVLFLLTTLMSIYALKVIPLYVGAVLESSNYLFVTFFGWFFFGERLNKRKLVGLGIILLGIFIFFSGGGFFS